MYKIGSKYIQINSYSLYVTTRPIGQMQQKMSCYNMGLDLAYKKSFIKNCRH